MNNVLETLKDFFTSPKMKTLYWQTANGFVVILIGTLTVIQPEEVTATTFLFIAGGVALLNSATKHINKTYLTK